MQVPRALGPRRRLVFAASLTVLSSLLLLGCEPEDRRVPFKLDPSSEGAGEGEPSSEPSDPDFEPRIAESLPSGRRQHRVGEATLTVPDLGRAGPRPSRASSGRLAAGEPPLELGAVLPLEGDETALVVLRSSAKGELTLATRRGDSFELASLARHELPEGCTAGDARIEQRSARAVIASVAHVCEHGESSTTWAVDVSRRPRLRETLRALPPGPDDPPLRVGAVVRDIDGDGRDDLEVQLSLEGSPSITLTWLDRPGGFSLNREEPTATIRAEIAEAEQALATSPDAAESKAAAAVALHEALCREGAAPRLVLGSTSGVQCESSSLLLRAEATRVAARIRRGRLVAALELEGNLRAQPGFREVATALLEPAWETAAAGSALDAMAVMSMEPLGGRGEALTALAFASEDALIVRGPLTRRITLGDENRSEVVLDPGPPIRDAEGGVAVLDVRNRCGTITATIVRTSAASHPVDAVTAVAEPVIAAPTPDPNAETDVRARPRVRCDGAEPALAPYDFTVLGFAPQGLVAARLAEVRVIPLTVNAQPAGEPQVLPGTTPLPAPIKGGMVTPDGSVYVLPTPYGVLRVERAREGEPSLLKPSAWTEAMAVRAVAIAPSGRRIAALRGNAVWVIDL